MCVSSANTVQHTLLPINSLLHTIRPNLAQENNKRCAVKHPSLRTFLLPALRRRFGGVWCDVKCCQYAIVAITNAVSCQFSAQPSLETEK